MNNEEYKCYAFDAGACIVRPQENKTNANVGAGPVSAQSHVMLPLQINKQNAITLISLAITIIIMLILAGVILSLTIGEHGIFSTAEKATKDYEKASLEEKLQLAIIDIQGEFITKGEELTLEKLQEKLSEKLGGSTKIEDGKIIGNIDGQEYEIDNNFNVTIKENIKGVRISYTLSNKEYTKDNIYLNLNVTSTEGSIVNIISKERFNEK